MTLIDQVRAAVEARGEEHRKLCARCTEEPRTNGSYCRACATALAAESRDRLRASGCQAKGCDKPARLGYRSCLAHGPRYLHAPATRLPPKPAPPKPPAPTGPNPTPSAAGERDLFCAHYDDCLDKAADWPGFSCEACPVRGQASPSRRDLVDLQATRRDCWQEGSKAARPSKQRQAAARVAKAQLAEQEAGIVQPRPPRRPWNRQPAECRTCGKPSYCRGYCALHYGQVNAAERKARGGA